MVDFDKFKIEDIECLPSVKEEFDEWFTGLMVAGHTSCIPSCFWRDIIRDNRRNLFKSFIERSKSE